MKTAAFFRNFFNRHGLWLSLFLLGGVTFWILILIVLPQVFMLDFSFRFNLPPARIGGTHTHTHTVKLGSKHACTLA